MQVVPLAATASQTLTVQLGGQNCTLNVRQTSTGLYMDVLVDGALIIGGVACFNLNVIVRSAYLGFVGDLAFLDTQGDSDPYYTGLGARYALIYLEAADLAAQTIT